MGCSVKTGGFGVSNKLNKMTKTVYLNGGGSTNYNANALFQDINPLYIGIDKVRASDTVREQVTYNVYIEDFNIYLDISSGISSNLEVTIFALY